MTFITHGFTERLLGIALLAATIPVLRSESPLVIRAGEDISARVNRAPAGTYFLLKAGHHTRQTVTPKDGMSFVGEDGTILDGEGVTSYAFETLHTDPRGVTIKGLTIERYAPPPQHGAIQGDNGRDWVIDGNIIRDNSHIGLRTGAGFVVRRNRVYGNGVIGISGHRADAARIEENEVFENGGGAGTETPATAEASGLKFLRTHDLIVRGNQVVRNLGIGIWSDTNYPTVVIEHNTVSENRGAGIWHEAGYAAVIRYNTVERNGGLTPGNWLTRAGIQVTNASNVQISTNKVTNNANGIGVMQTGGYPDGPYGPLRVENVQVTDNSVTMTIGRTGLAQNVGDRRVFTEWHNRFDNTTYHLGPNRFYFLWDERLLDERGWQAAGNDRSGRFIR
ncbi:MAG: hypothetical protein AUH72_07040 [Acidobacteria bacterium 13_1_40CM_4_65_8]|nr:MAG: hypothetical protein AUH72_07040 [Acidobacteria bacterium 13_1_40CM_4_65_8]